MAETQAAAPTLGAERITTLDAIRGVAVMGILLMNAVSFGLAPAAYNRLDAGGWGHVGDWIVGGAGEIFADQKFMGLFSMLFGAGIVLFADRAAAKGRRAGWLSLWRNALLAGIGVAHMAFWDGDVLLLYGLCAPFVLMARRLPVGWLYGLGAACFGVVMLTSWAVQSWLGSHPIVRSDFWSRGEYNEVVELWFLVDFAGRALGAMLIGAALYRSGILSGERSAAFYRRLAAWGLGFGLPLSVYGLWLVAGSGFSSDWAVAGTIPNTIATVPICLGYVGLIAQWNAMGNAARDGGLRPRVRALGRMALTNYLSQTALGLIVFGWLVDGESIGRSGILVFVVAVWALQLWWSKAWLERFSFGPVEWLWRCLTYRRPQRIRASA